MLIRRKQIVPLVKIKMWIKEVGDRKIDEEFAL
jgi:hypothetical protein